MTQATAAQAKAAAGDPLHNSTGAEIEAAMKAVCGVVFDVQRMSMHDGPGMRTNVFLKGCPLRCGWCANPESQLPQPQLTLHAANCIECGQFAEPCTRCVLPAPTPDRTATLSHSSPESLAPHAHTPTPPPKSSLGLSSPHAHVRSSARLRADFLLGANWTETEATARVDLCPTGALHWVGHWRTAGDVMAEVLRDRPFYGKDGGLTLTGGEPTMQPAMCEALLWLAKREGIATAMETCGHTQWAVYMRLLPRLDLLLYDIKHIDPAVHLQYTGVDNSLILDNLARLAAAGANVRVRIPLIPGFNAEPQTVAAIAEFVRQLPGPVLGIDLLPYHMLGKAKYAALGRPYPWAGHARLSEAEVVACAAAVRAHNLPVTIGG
jgi:glycyl-radical enzyme activating protein